MVFLGEEQEQEWIAFCVPLTSSRVRVSILSFVVVIAIIVSVVVGGGGGGGGIVDCWKNRVHASGLWQIQGQHWQMSNGQGKENSCCIVLVSPKKIEDTPHFHPPSPLLRP